MARRGLTDGEAIEVDSEQAIYRPSRPAARGFIDDVATPAAPARRLAARRLLTDDTTTIRPSLRGFASPVVTTFIRTRHASRPRERKLRVAAALMPVVAIAAIAGLVFVVPSSSGQTVPPVVAAIAHAPSDPIVPVANDDTSTLTAASGAAADALATDRQVKAAAAKAAAEKAAAEAGAAAQAAQAQGRPGLTVMDWAQYSMAGTPVAVDDGQFIYPVKGFTLSSGFGWRTVPYREFHSGIDLAAPCGTPIVAAADGVVTYVGWNSGLGNYAEINHGTLSTGYGHQSSIAVTVGQQVKQGQLIGYVGSTGLSTGCHVHFQALNPQGGVFDPRSLIH
ncbi:MAG: M23 family metallopeptidase [Propionibacteriaceae bacterium]|nr:M23 family metallopeptidase [Propionibacteriaceae bacterium]